MGEYAKDKNGEQIMQARKWIKCPECGQRHFAVSDYTEYNFGEVCDTCNDKEHAAFIARNPHLKAFIESQ